MNSQSWRRVEEVGGLSDVHRQPGDRRTSSDGCDKPRILSRWNRSSFNSGNTLWGLKKTFFTFIQNQQYSEVVVLDSMTWRLTLFKVFKHRQHIFAHFLLQKPLGIFWIFIYMLKKSYWNEIYPGVCKKYSKT